MYTFAMVNMCEEPHSCGTGGGNGRTIRGNQENQINRTFLVPNNGAFNSRNNRNTTPDLNISIDEQDLLALFDIGSTRIRWETLDGLNISMDVGQAVPDTQFWAFPSLDFVEGTRMRAVDTSTVPYLDSFPGANLVFKGFSSTQPDTIYNYYQISSAGLL